MALSIHSNSAAMTTSTSLNKISASLASSQQRLGTGYRINSAADDAAGLQVATRLEAQSRGMEVAMRNVQDASSMLQTADGALDEVTNILQRMKDLATQASSGTNTAADKTSMQAEYDELGKELGNIIENTKFNGEKLFGITGDSKFSAAVNFQIGASSTEKLTLNLSDRNTEMRTALDAASAKFQPAAPTQQQQQAADDATTALTTAQNNREPEADLARLRNALRTAQDALNPRGTELTVANPSAAIDRLASALESVSTMRGQLGANINRLSHIGNNLGNVKDNTDVARGRIMDTDFAKETSKATKQQMLTQSSIAMLKQTSQMPGMIMSLLG